MIFSTVASRPSEQAATALTIIPNSAVSDPVNREEAPPSNISAHDLAPELLLIIFSQATLSLNDLCQCTLVCRNWHDNICAMQRPVFSSTQGLESSDKRTYIQEINAFFASDKVKNALRIGGQAPLVSYEWVASMSAAKNRWNESDLYRPFKDLVDLIRSGPLRQGRLYDAMQLLLSTTYDDDNISLQTLSNIGCGISTTYPLASTYVLPKWQWAFFRRNLPDILWLAQKDEFDLEALLDLPEDALKLGFIGVLSEFFSRDAQAYDRTHILEKMLKNKILFFLHRKTYAQESFLWDESPLLWTWKRIMSAPEIRLLQQSPKYWFDKLIEAGMTLSIDASKEAEEFEDLLCKCIRENNINNLKQLLEIPLEESEQIDFLYDKLLRTAIKRKTTEIFEFLLPKANLNWRDHRLHSKHLSHHFEQLVNGQSASIGEGTLLHTAARFGNLMAVDSLLTQGANPNLQDANGDTPLGIALAENDTEIADHLLANGAQEEVRDEDLAFQLYIDAKKQNLDGIRELQQQGLKIDWKDDFHWLALNAVIGEGRFDFVEVLFGAEEAEPDPILLYKTVHGIIGMNHLSAIMRVLIRRMQKIAPDYINQRDDQGCTLLLRAVREQASLDVFQIFFEAGANPKLRREVPSERGRTVEELQKLEDAERREVDYKQATELGCEDLLYSISRFQNALEVAIEEECDEEIINALRERIKDINVLDL